MIINKKIDLGEYIIHIKHDEQTGLLEVNILDELGDEIEQIVINNSEDDESETDLYKPILN
jgi:hypothetical protein